MGNNELENLLHGMLEKVGGKAIEELMHQLSKWPDNRTEALGYYDNIRQNTIEAISNTEFAIKQNMKLLMDKKKFKEFKILTDTHNILRSVRQDIDKTLLTNFSTKEQEYAIVRSITTVYLSLQYEVFVIKNLSNNITMLIFNDENIMNNLIDLVGQAKHLQTTVSLKNQALSNPTLANVIFKQLKEETKIWEQLLEESAKYSRYSMNQVLNNAILSRPRLFNRKEYIEKLSDYIWIYSNKNEIDRIEVPELINKIRGKMPNVEFKDDDVEKAIKLMIKKNRAYSLKIINNIKVVEFKRTDKSFICGYCGKHGGIYEEFRTCQNEGKHVCGDCITFFGKCKLCGEKINTRHPLAESVDELFIKPKWTLTWDHSEDDKNAEFFWRIPNTEIPSLVEYDEFKVNTSEKVILYTNGKHKIFETGVYKLDKKQIQENSELIYYDPKLIDFAFKINRSDDIPLITSDGFKIGCSGIMSVQIKEPNTLIRNIITGNPNFNNNMLIDKIITRAKSSLKTIVQKYTLKDFVLKDRHILTSMMQTDMQKDLEFMGLELNSVIAEDIDVADDDKSILDNILQNSIK